MKKSIILFVALLSYVTVNSQYYYLKDSTGQNPGGLNMDDEFPSGSGLPSGWTQILNGSNASPSWSSINTIPFSFSFNASAVTKYKVSSSGVLTFKTTATTAPAYTSVALPSATIPDSSVCILGIKGTGSNDKIMTKTFGTSPNRQHWIFFTSYSTTSTTSWSYWSIVLEETTNNIYVVDQRHGAAVSGLSIGIQINSTTAKAVTGSPSVSSLAIGNLPGQVDNHFYKFKQGIQPAYDMTTKSSTVPSVLVLNQAPFTIGGKVSNFGSTTVTSYDMNYKVGASSTVTSNITSVSIASAGSAIFSHPTTWTPASIGNYTIKTWASNINGNADLDNSNDTLTFNVSVVDTVITRKALMEVFTSSTCGPCKPGNTNMDNVVVPTISNYTIIKYQQNFPGAGDPYQTAESVARRGFYGINSIPRMEIDGEWDQNANSLTASIFNGFQAKYAFVKIDFISAIYAGPYVRVKATITPVANLTGNLKYHLVITEKKTTMNTASNGETEFFHVMMDMVPDQNGNNMTSLNANTPTNVNLITNLSSSNVEEFHDLKAVVFVQDMTTKEIYQSEWMDISKSLVSIDELSDNDLKILVYPNPSNGEFTLNYKKSNDNELSITVTNLIGKTVYQETANNTKGEYSKKLNLSHLPKGIYMINLVSNNIKTTRKIVIQ